jgi:hypothetical protein
VLAAGDGSDSDSAEPTAATAVTGREEAVGGSSTAGQSATPQVTTRHALPCAITAHMRFVCGCGLLHLYVMLCYAVGQAFGGSSGSGSGSIRLITSTAPRYLRSRLADHRKVNTILNSRLQRLHQRAPQPKGLSASSQLNQTQGKPQRLRASDVHETVRGIDSILVQLQHKQEVLPAVAASGPSAAPTVALAELSSTSSSAAAVVPHAFVPITAVPTAATDSGGSAALHTPPRNAPPRVLAQCALRDASAKLAAPPDPTTLAVTLRHFPLPPSKQYASV